MEKVVSIEQYRSIQKEFKPACRRPLLHCVWSEEQINRHIDKGRLYCLKGEWGFAFLSDEETYYQCEGYFDPAQKPGILPADKKILLRTIYQEGRTDAVRDSFEEQLIAAGFAKEDATYRFQLDIEENLERIVKLGSRAEEMINDMGFYMGFPDREDVDALNELMFSSDILEDIHFFYRDREELEKEIDEKDFLCVKDKDGKICAVSRAYVNNGIAEGDGIVVLEEYKKTGLTVALSAKRCILLNEMGVKYIRAWIIDTNRASIRYHTSLGWKKNGRVANEWILQKKG